MLHTGTRSSSATSQKFLPEAMGAGVAMVDYNNDGLLDLYRKLQKAGKPAGFALGNAVEERDRAQAANALGPRAEVVTVGAIGAVGGEQVGLQRGAGDGRAGGAAGGGQGSFESVDLAEQVAVPVEEGPVHGGSAGDPGHGDLGAVVEGLVECGDDALPATCGVGLPAGAHFLGPAGRG